ncbi:MAG: hypothetical protein IKA74_00175 [Clostridia bacterium]|nr:hypothetical protein [Clostridia bacterium]
MKICEKITKEADGFGGAYYIADNSEGLEIFEEDFCRFDNAEGFCASYLNDPFFPHTDSFDSVSNIPYETQWLAVKYKGGGYAIAIPLVADGYRTAFFGTKEGYLAISSECGDASAVREKFRAAYIIEGDSLSDLMDRAALSLKENLGISLRGDKKTPSVVNLFGWCTWDAFYERVSAADVERELEIFKNAGFIPKFILLDDGWQSVCEYGTGRGHHMLSSFAPNEKFGGSLTPLVEKMKNEYGVELFYVWHAVGGYWGGASPFSEEMEKYSPKFDAAVVAKGMFRGNPQRAHSECFAYGLVNDFGGFYNDYHKSLKSQGVDGVKVDVQSIIASHGRGNGGRAAITAKMRHALENSVDGNFSGELINCMSCTNDIVFNSPKSNLARSSDDFFPLIPESHFRHVYYNAVNSFFMGRFTVCDWDMFHSVHEYAEFHAKARAISGGPIYVSDKTAEHNFQIFERLTASDGHNLRCEGVGRISERSMFVDFNTANEPLYIENNNRYGEVVGAFNPKTDKSVSVKIEKRDGYALRSFGGKCAVLNADFEDELQKNGAEIYTLMPIEDGFAIFGLADKYNGAAAILSVERGDTEIRVTLADGGRVCIYSEKEVRKISANSTDVTPKNRTGFILFDTKTNGKTEIIIK